VTDQAVAGHGNDTASVIVFSGSGPLSKRIWAEFQQSKLVLRKEVSKLQPSCYETVVFPLSDWSRRYEAFIGQLDPSSFLCHATIKAPSEGRVITKAKLEKLEPSLAADFVARSNEFLSFPVGAGIMLIDTDEEITPEQFDLRLRAVLPSSEGVGRVSYASSGSYIYTEMGEQLRGASGLHTAIMVADASDIQRAGRALCVRLVLRGDYRAVISRSGHLELRTLIDMAMLRPTQPEFASGCYLDNARSAVKLVQKRPQPVLREGAALDSRLSIPDLTTEEQRTYDEIVRTERQKHRGEIESHQASCRERLAKAVKAPSGRAIRVARSAIADSDLVPPFPLETNAGDLVPISEIISAPHDASARGWAFRDPLEPEYGQGKARVFVEPDGRITLRSFAHGGRTFQIGHDDESAIERLKSLEPEGVVKAWFQELRIHFLGGEPELDTVMRCLKQLTDVSLGALRSQEKVWRAQQQKGEGLSLLDAEEIDVAEQIRDEGFGGEQYLTFAEDLTFRYFKDRYWLEIPEHHLRQQAQKGIIEWREDKCLRARAKGRSLPTFKRSVPVAAGSVVDALRASQTQKLDFTRMHEEWPALLNFRNGTLDLDTLERRPHDPKDRFLYAAPFDYDPNATTLYYDLLLDLIWPNMPEVWRHFEEVLGYAIQPKRFLKLVVAAWGNGFNGKTPLFFGIPRAILGATVVGPMQLHLLDDDKFASADPVGKLILVEDDLKAGMLWPDSQLKKLSERSLLRGERKNAHPFSFMNNAVPIVIGNSVPRMRDNSLATAERLQVFRLEHAFRDGVGRYPQKWAEDLVGGIFKDELAGIVNRLIAGYQRIKARGPRGALDPPKECLRWRGEYLREGNQLLQFLEEKTERGAAQDKVEATFLFDLYGTWCSETRRQPDTQLGRNTFYEKLRELGYRVDAGHAGYQCVYGLRVTLDQP